MKQFRHLYGHITTPIAIFNSFAKFRQHKRRSADILLFTRNLADNLFALHRQLQDKTYRPGPYTSFYINDPKVRLIHKVPVVDRVVHHLVSRQLERIFDPTFIAQSYSCRSDKGTHLGVRHLYQYARQISHNYTRSCFALKCDIRKFFASVNHSILFRALSQRITDPDFLNLLKKIIGSFNPASNRGLPIGNLTSQIFANIYLNQLDQFIKHQLKVKFYLRYSDDFVILSPSLSYLRSLLPSIHTFLKHRLDLDLHPHKVKFLNLESGIDFLGYIVLPHHILPRHKTYKRLLRKITAKINQYHQGKINYHSLYQTVQSYLGYLSHANSYKLRQYILKLLPPSPLTEQNP